MDRKRTEENSDFLPKTGNPMNETVWYKIGRTYYEVETPCGGSELLYDKMVRLLKSGTFADPADKAEKVRYNDGSNLFAGCSLQEERTMRTTKNFPDNITALYVELSSARPEPIQ